MPIKRAKLFLKKMLESNKLLYIVTAVTLICVITTFFLIFSYKDDISPNPVLVTILEILDLVTLLILAILLTRSILNYWLSKSSTSMGGRLQRRIVMIFSLVSAIPTIAVAIFAATFFNIGIQAWFDKRINMVLDQSVKLTDFYLEENKNQLKNTAVALSSELSDLYHELILSKGKFSNVLNASANLSNIHEAIVFQKSTHSVLAKTALSFSLVFTTIPSHIFSKAEQGEVVELDSDPTKIRILIKLQGYSDAYLIVGKLIDRKILNYRSKTYGAVQEYSRLKNEISLLQIQFAVMFIAIALLLLLTSISSGLILAKRIFQPIRNLVLATEKVKLGSLNIQLQETHTNDELDILTSAFNRMIKQLERQNKDLVIAQRALAWSDVARRVAHEIKNPLTPIQLAADRLSTKFTKEVQDQDTFQRYISTITRHVYDINKIVSGFSNFAKIPSPTFVECDIICLIKDLIESQKILNDKIEYKFFSNLKHLLFAADITQMNQIIVNLLKNSEESLENSNILSKKIEVILSKPANEIVILEIKDNGNGFPLNLINQITDPYVTTRLKGTGLGLAIVKKITEDHFGNVEISNLESGGASVKLSFNYLQLLSKLPDKKYS